MKRIFWIVAFFVITLAQGNELDRSNQFTISGDLSHMDIDLADASVIVTATEYDNSGQQRTLEIATEGLIDGKFLIQADIDEPRCVTISLRSGGNHASTSAVIEPQTAITLTSRSSWIKDLVALSGSGKHFELVESWQLSEEYQSTAEAYRIAYQDFDNESTNENSTEKEKFDTKDNVKVFLQRHLELDRKLSLIRYDVLNKFALNAENPIDTLLALELGAFERNSEALPLFDKLAKTLDEDLVARRVTHARETHLYRARVKNDQLLVVGESVSNFSLLNAEGEEISLFNLLDENEFVFVDFWATWCAPCVAEFAPLKDLYSSYNEQGLEIVSISIDQDRDAWLQVSEEQELPWHNLAELEGWTGDVIIAYGANFIPKGFLINSDGQIVLKDVSSVDLEKFLSQKYDES